MSDSPQIPKQQILDFSKEKDLADDKFIFNENGRKVLKQVENNVFKRLVLQTSKNQGLFGKRLIVCKYFQFSYP